MKPHHETLAAHGLQVLLRLVLLVAASTLAIYIPFKYLTQLHALTGLYAFLFPLSGLLAVGGLVLAVDPGRACSCSTEVRAGAGVLAVGWMATGLLCVPSLVETVRVAPMGGAIAFGHMLLQHIILSSAILAFAIAPRWSAALFGAGHGSSARLRSTG